jgi:hypothetical protein
MTGDREMRAAHDRNDTQLMLARDADDERGGNTIAPLGARLTTGIHVLIAQVK